MAIMTNPLRYPGAKRTLSTYVQSLLTSNHLDGCVFFEPYAGSAAVGLDLLQKNMISRLVLCEKDVLLAAFWKCVFQNPNELCQKIMSTPITIETWKSMTVYREYTTLRDASLIDLAFAGLFFNRTNFSGILKANPIGGMHQASQYDISCRFNKEKTVEIILKLSAYAENVEVHHDDALSFMKTQEKNFIRYNCFAYFDPPYYVKGSKIYRHYYVNKDHIELSQYVRSVKHLDWLISYDDAPFICGLYTNSGAKYQPFFLDYSCASKVRSKGQELLISNLPLPPVSVSSAAGM